MDGNTVYLILMQSIYKLEFKILLSPCDVSKWPTYLILWIFVYVHVCVCACKCCVYICRAEIYTYMYLLTAYMCILYGYSSFYFILIIY